MAVLKCFFLNANFKGDIFMALSKESLDSIRDMIENRLSMMMIGDRDDLREHIVLKKALTELLDTTCMPVGHLKNYVEIPRRGRHRKLSAMIDESERA
jgi:hypothetical protein